MKNIYIASFVLLLIHLASCKKDSQLATAIVAFTSFEITVKDGNSWSSATGLKNDSGAIVKLYKTKDDILNNAPPAYTITTDQSGTASLEFDPAITTTIVYYFTVEKGNAKNVINNILVKGIFTGPILIRSNGTPLYNYPKLGSPVFYDANNDGVIQSPGDDVYADNFYLNIHAKVVKQSIIF